MELKKGTFLNNFVTGISWPHLPPFNPAWRAYLLRELANSDSNVILSGIG
jgi:hypothetical protein